MKAQLDLDRKGFVDNSSSNKQAISFLIDNNPNVEPRIGSMIEDGLKSMLKKLQSNAVLAARLDLLYLPIKKNIKSANPDRFFPATKAMVPKTGRTLTGDDILSIKSGLIDASAKLTKMRNQYIVKKQGYFMPWIVMLVDEANIKADKELEDYLMEKIKKDELRIFTIVIGQKKEEYVYSFMDESNCYYVDAKNRLDKALDKIIESMMMASKSSEKVRMQLQKNYIGAISWAQAAERVSH